MEMDKKKNSETTMVQLGDFERIGRAHLHADGSRCCVKRIVFWFPLTKTPTHQTLDVRVSQNGALLYCGSPKNSKTNNHYFVSFLGGICWYILSMCLAFFFV